MAGHGEKKVRKRDTAVLALLTEPTIRKAAEKTGVNESTLWRWMQEEDFKKQYQQAKQEAVGQATSRLRQSMTAAVDALVDMAENPKTPAIARANAARTLLEFGFKAHENEDIQKRMDALEEALSEDEKKSTWKGGA